MFNQGKCRSPLHKSPCHVIGQPRSDLDETLDEPFHEPLDFFTHEIRFPEHLQKVQKSSIGSADCDKNTLEL